MLGRFSARNLGLARHLAGDERWCVRIPFAVDDSRRLYCSDENPEQDFTGLDGDSGQAQAGPVAPDRR